MFISFAENLSVTQQQDLWDLAFNNNYKTVAKCISEAIATATFSAFASCCNDMHQTMPIQSSTRMKYGFNLLEKMQAQELKDISLNSHQLAPFEQWFSIFCNPCQYIRYCDDEEINSLTLPKGLTLQNVPAKRAYFREKMTILLEQTFAYLGAIFESFSEKSYLLHHVMKTAETIEHVFIIDNMPHSTPYFRNIPDQLEKVPQDSNFNYLKKKNIAWALYTYWEIEHSIRTRRKEVHILFEKEQTKLGLNVTVWEQKALSLL